MEEVHRMNFSRGQEWKWKKRMACFEELTKKRSSNEKIKSVDNLSVEQVLLLDEGKGVVKDVFKN